MTDKDDTSARKLFREIYREMDADHNKEEEQAEEKEQEEEPTTTTPEDKQKILSEMLTGLLSALKAKQTTAERLTPKELSTLALAIITSKVWGTWNLNVGVDVGDLSKEEADKLRTKIANMFMPVAVGGPVREAAHVYEYTSKAIGWEDGEPKFLTARWLHMDDREPLGDLLTRLGKAMKEVLDPYGEFDLEVAVVMPRHKDDKDPSE